VFLTEEKEEFFPFLHCSAKKSMWQNKNSRLVMTGTICNYCLGYKRTEAPANT
jgi:hypothetical protein